MDIICINNEIVIRKLEKYNTDFELLHKWLNNEKVFEHYGDNGEKNFEFVKQK